MSKILAVQRNEELFPDLSIGHPRRTRQRSRRQNLSTKHSTGSHGRKHLNLFADGHDERPEGRFSVVSMFSGCGGMDLGFHGDFTFLGRRYDPLPFDVIWANELNPAACRTYRKNLGVQITCDDVWAAIESIPRQADVLIGGFPCQDVSVNGKRQGVNGKRTGLYKAMIEGIKRTKPKIFIAENVKGLLMKRRQRRYVGPSRTARVSDILTQISSTSRGEVRFNGR